MSDSPDFYPVDWRLLTVSVMLVVIAILIKLVS